MLRRSNSLIGVINFITFVISIPILGAGVWLSNKANTDCLRFLQWPLIILGVTIMVLSLAGFAGSCYRITCLLQLYLFAMFFVILALFGFIIFAFVVTNKGGGRAVQNRSYLEYHLDDYSGWLKDRVSDSHYWSKITECLRKADVCGDMAKYVRAPDTGVLQPEPADLFYRRKLNPFESGCCKPPTSCGYMYMNETLWIPGGGTSMSAVDDADCTRWSNDQQVLCYGCDSCKAGVLAAVRRSWRKAAVVTIVVLIVLVLIYVVAVAAHRNNRRRDNDEGYGVNRMTKYEPSRFRF